MLLLNDLLYLDKEQLLALGSLAHFALIVFYEAAIESLILCSAILNDLLYLDMLSTASLVHFSSPERKSLTTCIRRLMVEIVLCHGTFML